MDGAVICTGAVQTVTVSDLTFNDPVVTGCLGRR